MASPIEFSYTHYRQQILNEAQKLGLGIHAYCPYQEYPGLETLFVYNKALTTSAEILMHISGTHGIEGKAGAEIQCHLLRRHGLDIVDSSHGILLVFALNPFGFEFHRRVSIENIDLNRNTGADLPRPPQRNSGDWLRPLWRSKTLGEQLRGFGQTLTLMAVQGISPVTKMFAEGQLVEPHGVFYSGLDKAIEIQTFIKQLQPFLPKASRLKVLDIHTGLGRLYEEMLMASSKETGTLNKVFSKALEIPGEKPYSYRGHGLLSDRLGTEFPNIDVQVIVQEFGIKSTAHSLLALLLENKYHWEYFNKVSNKLYLKHPIKKMFAETFFNSDPDWLSWLKKEGAERFFQWLESPSIH